MNTKIIKLPNIQEVGEVLKWPHKNLEPWLLFLSLVLLWLFIPDYIYSHDPRASYLDPYIPVLIILSLITFMVISALCWWLLHRFWMALALPDLSLIVSQFKTLTLWQQLSFYWLSFALLLLAALGCLNAIC